MQKLRKRRRTVFAEVNIGGRDACANRSGSVHLSLRKKIRTFL